MRNQFELPARATEQRNVFFCFAAGAFLSAISVPANAQEDVKVPIETHFSPNRDGARPIQDAWIRELGNATWSIRVAMYSFTLQPFKNALIEAKSRGIDVRVLADKTGLFFNDVPSCPAVDLYNAGIPI